MYNFDFVKFIKRMLPWFLLRPKHQAWLYVLLKPVKIMHGTFLDFRTATFYKLKFTSQVNSLETLLNDQFNGGAPAYTGTTPTGIYISNSDQFIPPTYLYNKVEQRPALILYNKAEAMPPVYLNNLVEFQLQYDFVVHVPYAVGNVTTDTALITKIKAWVDFYRLAGKRYILVNY